MKKVVTFTPIYCGDTKSSPSTGTAGGLSGKFASLSSTGFNDGVSGRSEFRNSGSRDSFPVPDSLTGARFPEDGRVDDEASSET